MIKIEEATTKKLPGFTSLFVSFDYKPEIVDVIKSLSNCIYDKTAQIWEVPLTVLTQLLDRLCTYDDIELTLLKDKKVKSDQVFELHEYKTKPFDYQLDGIQFGLNHDSWLLLDAPGLGKTLQLIYLAQELKERDGLEHCLVICGINTLKYNWKKEIQQHSNLSCKILGERVTKTGKTKIGSVADRVADLKSPIDEFFVVTNVETLRSDDIVNAINKGPNTFDMIIVDEIHTCFDYNTMISTENGPFKIGDIVSNNINCKVFSYNDETDTIELNPITEYYAIPCSGKIMELEFETDAGQSIIIHCTDTHKIYTENRGYVQAKDLTDSDIIKLINY